MTMENSQQQKEDSKVLPCGHFRVNHLRRIVSAEGIEPWRTKRVALTLCHLWIYCSTA